MNSDHHGGLTKHPKGRCQGKRCSWCNPRPGLVRVDLNVRVEMDVGALCRDMGITDMGANDPKIWLEEDLAVLVSKLPYLKHIHGVEVRAKGLSRDGRYR